MRRNKKGQFDRGWKFSGDEKISKISVLVSNDFLRFPKSRENGISEKQIFLRKM